MIAPSGSDLSAATRRPLSFLQTVKAVAWSFLGLRKRSGYEQDVQELNPVHVIVAGIVGALIFILALILVVKWVVGSGVAA
jgi:hypothetical protein